MFQALLLMVSVGIHSASSLSTAGLAPAMPSAPGQIDEQVQTAEPAPAAQAELQPRASVEDALNPPADDAASAVSPAFLSPQTPQLVAEPQTATGKFTTALEVKPILNATRGNWITVREYDGKDLVYVTHLWAWRCGLLELRVGINGNTPEPWPMPECHLDLPAPGAILETDGLPYRQFALGSIALVEIQITYDDLTTAGAKYNRQGMLVE